MMVNRQHAAPAVRTLWAALALAGCLAGNLRGQAPTAGQTEAAAYARNPKFVQAYAEARDLAARGNWVFAADAYRKANKIAGGSCAGCLEGAYKAQMNTGRFKDAADTAGQLEQVVLSPGNKSVAKYLQAEALAGQAGAAPKPSQLQEIHRLLAESIELNSKNAAALFLDGQMLARMGDLDAARTEFTACLSCANPTDPMLLRARHFAEDPTLSTRKMAPALAVTALDGTKFNLDAMGGRVVLIDFWATWCAPCNRELPHLKKIAQEFAGRPLVIISVSWDADEAKWKDFIQKNGMTWVQYRDADHALSTAFGVQAIPHYFTIDADGVLTAEMLGEDSDVEGKLRKLVSRAEQQRNAVAQLGSAAGGS